LVGDSSPFGQLSKFSPHIFFILKSGFAFCAAFDVSNLAVSREKQFKNRQTIIH